MTGFQLARSWRILILGPDANLAQGIRAVFSQEAPSAQIFEVRAYPDLADLPKLFGSQPLSVCFLDVATSAETALPLIREIQLASPTLAVVAALPSDDAELILKCLRQGASEFVTHPFQPVQMGQALLRMAKGNPALGAPSATARMVSVIPVKGACGASTIAANLAFQRKRLGVKKVLLADLDALTGTVSFILSSRPSYSFLDALSRGTTLDQDVWKGLIQTVDGVDVLYSPDAVTEAIYDLRNPEPLLEFARRQYDLILTDQSSLYGEWNLRLARAADEILLISTNDASSIRSTQRALRHMEEQRINPEKVRLVINRFNREFGVGTEVAQTTLQKDIFATLPADYESVHRALIDGKPMPPGTPFGKGLAALADALGGPKSPEPAPVPGKSPSKPGALSGLLGLLGRKPSPSR